MTVKITTANGANNGGNILMENGDLIKIYIGQRYCWDKKGLKNLINRIDTI